MGQVYAQVAVTGKVSQENDGSPMIGVTVTVNGTSIGALTDPNGNFSIQAPSENVTLTFSFIGFDKLEVPLNGQTTLKIFLKETEKTMEEVVIVGYGTQKKSVVTGAISSVKSKDLEDMPVMRVEQSLQGRTSGVRVTLSSGQPGAGAVVRIRGTGTINNSDPLYVVDGVPIGGGIDYLNQNDIESMEVLKDAASAAIYGARAANGVVLITTKSGKAGKMKINYNGYYGVQNPWRKLAVLDAREYGILMNEAAAAAGQNLLFSNPDTLGAGTDWQEQVFYQNAPITNHDVSISGGTDRSNFLASVSYFKQDGIVAQGKSNYERFTVRLNNGNQVKPWLKFGNNFGYTHVVSQGVAENSEWGSPLGIALNIDPVTPVYETNPIKLAGYNPLAVRDENGVFAITQYVTSEIVNPLAKLAVTHANGWSDKVVGNGFAEIRILDGLTFRSNIGVDLAFWGSNSFTPTYYLNASNQVINNSVFRGMNRGLTWIWENTLSYNKSFGKHNLSALLGTSAQKSTGVVFGGGKQDLPSNDPSQAYIFAATNIESEYVYDGVWNNTLRSYIGRINYNYDERFLLSAVLRRDGSSRFGSNNKFGTFPSISAGWVLSRENFYNLSNVMDFLKIRASWGQNGNENIGDFLYESTVSGGNNYTFGINDQLVNGVKPTRISNPDLRWETSEQTNIGIDAVFLQKITLTIDLYDKRTKGMLMTIPVPDYVGNGSPVGNAGDMQNRGFEIEAGYRKAGGEFTYSLSSNFSFVQNKVLLLGNDDGYLSGQTFGPQGLVITRTQEGLPIGYFFGFKTDGLFQNTNDVLQYTNSDGELLQPEAKPGDMRFVDVNGDGIINEDDRTMIGDPTPNYTYGFTFNAAYKGFDFVVFGQGVFGNQIYKATRRYDLPRANMTADALGRWTGEGTSTDYPRLTLNDTNRNFSRSSDFYVESGAFFRIKTLQLGYTLPATVTRVAGIERARFYISAANLLTLTQYSGFDPEIGASFGVDRGIYPQARSYSVGANITL